MQKLKFYDLVKKKPFMSDKYTFKMKSGRKFAVAKSPSGKMCWRIVSKEAMK